MLSWLMDVGGLVVGEQVDTIEAAHYMRTRTCRPSSAFEKHARA
jgi:hypothetical protein